MVLLGGSHFKKRTVHPQNQKDIRFLSSLVLFIHPRSNQIEWNYTAVCLWCSECHNNTFGKTQQQRLQTSRNYNPVTQDNPQAFVPCNGKEVIVVSISVMNMSLLWVDAASFCAMRLLADVVLVKENSSYIKLLTIFPLYQNTSPN